MKLKDTLEIAMRSCDGIQSMMIVDRDGVPMITVGNEIRNRIQITTAFESTLEQATKLNMGEQKSWVFHYDTHQMVILNMAPIAIFIIATTDANTAFLVQLRSRLLPAINQCKSFMSELHVVA